MRSFLRFHLCLWLALATAGDAATRIQVSECLGSHGERVFSDTDCVGASVREWSLALPSSAVSSVLSICPEGWIDVDFAGDGSAVWNRREARYFVLPQVRWAELYWWDDSRLS